MPRPKRRAGRGWCALASALLFALGSVQGCAKPGLPPTPPVVVPSPCASAAPEQFVTHADCSSASLASVCARWLKGSLATFSQCKAVDCQDRALISDNGVTVHQLSVDYAYCYGKECGVGIRGLPAMGAHRTPTLDACEGVEDRAYGLVVVENARAFWPLFEFELHSEGQAERSRGRITAAAFNIQHDLELEFRRDELFHHEESGLNGVRSKQRRGVFIVDAQGVREIASTSSIRESLSKGQPELPALESTFSQPVRNDCADVPSHCPFVCPF
jgi:hypothetical protein